VLRVSLEILITIAFENNQANGYVSEHQCFNLWPQLIYISSISKLVNFTIISFMYNVLKS